MLKRVEADPAHKWDPDPEGDRDPGPGKPIVRSPARERGTDWNQGPIPRKTREADNRGEAAAPAEALWGPAAPAAAWVQVQVGAAPDRAGVPSLREGAIPPPPFLSIQDRARIARNRVTRLSGSGDVHQGYKVTLPIDDNDSNTRNSRRMTR